MVLASEEVMGLLLVWQRDYCTRRPIVLEHLQGVIRLGQSALSGVGGKRWRDSTGVFSPKEDRMTKRFYTLAGALLAATALMVAQSGRTIQVDVIYTGSGMVDAGHKIYVALWRSPNMDGAPADVQPLASKIGMVTFKN